MLQYKMCLYMVIWWIYIADECCVYFGTLLLSHFCVTKRIEKQHKAVRAAWKFSGDK